MTTVSKTSRPLCRFEFDHFETAMRAISSVTIDPLISIFCYVIPWIGAYSAYQMQVRPNDKLQFTLLSETSKRDIAGKIDALRIKAGIGRNVEFYTSLNFSCSSYGGSYSITNPVISIPAPFLITPRASIFSTSDDPVQISDKKWVFTPDEVSFFIAREMALIKSNDNFLRLVTKILLIGTFFFIFMSPITVFWGAATLTLSTSFYAYSERSFEAKLDHSAVQILTAYYNDNDRARKAALSALEKLREQNIERRKTNRICRYYITDKGNNLLDPCHPFLSNRIESIRCKNGVVA